VRSGDLEFVHLAHVVAPGVEARVGVFFAAREWSGEPAIVEPDKCSELGWFAVDALPASGELLEYAALGLRALQGLRALWSLRAGEGTGERAGEAEGGGLPAGGVGATFSVHGWGDQHTLV
jgi:hypothetical protein